MVGHDVGQVFDLSRPEKIARAIADFFSDSERIDTWRDNLRVVREQLSWQCEGERLKEIYEALA